MSMNLNRSIEQWRGGKPEMIASGSPAQVLFALTDAQHDVLMLHAEVERLRAQLDVAPQDFSKPPDPLLAGKIPLVLYFSTRADAEEFTAVVKDAMANPVDLRIA